MLNQKLVFLCDFRHIVLVHPWRPGYSRCNSFVDWMEKKWNMIKAREQREVEREREKERETSTSLRTRGGKSKEEDEKGKEPHSSVPMAFFCFIGSDSLYFALRWKKRQEVQRGKNERKGRNEIHATCSSIVAKIQENLFMWPISLVIFTLSLSFSLSLFLHPPFLLVASHMSKN